LFIGGGLAAGVAGIGTAAYYYRNQSKRKPKPVDIEPINVNNMDEFKVKPWSESPQAKAERERILKTNKEIVNLTENIEPAIDPIKTRRVRKPVLKPKVYKDHPTSYLYRHHSKPRADYSGPQRYLPSKTTAVKYREGGRFAKRPIYQMEISRKVMKVPPNLKTGIGLGPTGRPLNLQPKKRKSN
jgi:hypothetical protein